MIITINGKPGSGKSTVAKALARKLGFHLIDAGAYRRRFARKRGMSLQELNKLGESKAFTDHQVDAWLKREAKKYNNAVLSSRTAFAFFPHSIKIFLDVSIEVGARRIWHDLQKSQARNEGANLKSYRDTVRSLHERIKSDTVRYKKYYRLNIFLKKHYDLYLDTTRLTTKQEIEQVYRFAKLRLEKTKTKS